MEVDKGMIKIRCVAVFDAYTSAFEDCTKRGLYVPSTHKSPEGNIFFVFQYSVLFQNLIWDQFEAIKKANDNISETQCTEKLEKLHESIRTKFEKGKYSVSGGYKMYEQDLKKLKENYLNSKEKLGPKVLYPNILLNMSLLIYIA